MAVADLTTMTAALTDTFALAATPQAPAAVVAAEGFLHRTVTTGDGVRLAVRDYQAERADAPTVVLLHGLLLSQESWSNQVCQLRRQWGTDIRVITYDHRGHGRSSDAAMSTYRIDQLAADLADVLTAMRITGPLTLAGHSMGGMTALAYLGRPADERPVEPAGLVLVGTAAGSIAERGVGRALASPVTEALFGLVDRMPRRATDQLAARVAQPVGAALKRIAPEGSALAVASSAVVSTTSLATATGFLPSLKNYAAYDTLSSITAKTIVVSGGIDVVTPASHSHDLAAAIPGAIHLHHPTAGHMLLQEAAEAVTGAISRAAGASRKPARHMRSRTTQLAVLVG